jgi:hypothetical protein
MWRGASSWMKTLSAPERQALCSNQGFGYLQHWFGPKPEIVDIWGLSGPDRSQNLSKKVEAFALNFCGGVWKPIGPVWNPNIGDFRLRPKPWLQTPQTLVSMPVPWQRCGAKALAL